ncbi:hypothetical protein ACFWBG_06720 [Nocardia salmonicida]|uniref:hypothetical protein n=1 Tax=Nocardia salmonicida TaxID=53431 RepID=UPI003671A85F
MARAEALELLSVTEPADFVLTVGFYQLVCNFLNTFEVTTWTPDASRALARLGNTPDAYGQTWHLPVDPNRQSYAQLIEIADEVTGRKISYTVLPMLAFRLGRHFVEPLDEMYELLGRYRDDNIFDSSKFAARFPDFQVTTYREGVKRILTD